MDKKFHDIDNKFNKSFKEVNDKMDNGFKKIKDKVDNGFKEINDKVDEESRKINNKLDVITNSNMAQILSAQTNNMKQMNQKLDKYIEKNEVEHKKFDYEISNLEMNLKFVR